MSAQYAIEKDLNELIKMAEGLEDYLRSDQVYGSAGGGMFGSGSTPALTIGSVLLRLRRIEALRELLSPRDAERFDAVRHSVAATRKEWKMHDEEKLLREAHSRLDSMRPFFREANDQPSMAPNIYMPEANRRSIVQEILLELKEMGITDEDLKKKTRDIDGMLRGYVKATPFIWDMRLQPVYPEDLFWWLYRRPAKVEARDN